MTIEDSRRGDAWHVDEDDLRAYVRGELAAPALWSADAHLTACATCRGTL
ncbi:zf-HC2 domain-containing protein, partial [Streptomyces sp. SID6013]|nr:zf-HC2 domain-containing protein [Streptomyces sp. SID6013]